MPIKKALQILVAQKNLSQELTYEVAREIIDATATPAQVGALLFALAAKGETIEEITGLALAMQQAATRVHFDFPVLDTCGNGGDIKHTFNISTTAALIVAGCGIKVAKHGNRAITSNSGSADVLEELGFTISADPERAKQCVEQVGIGFFFAPHFHPAMKNVMAPRKELGIRTVFNILGPLISPAGAQYQVIGTPDKKLALKLINVVENLNTEHVLIVSGEDGMDEISLCAPTSIYEFNRGKKETKHYIISPEDFGFSKTQLSELQSFSRQESATILRGILEGSITGPKRDIVLLNAAAALIASNKTTTWSEGITLAQESIDSGKALKKLHALVAFSRK